MMKIVHTSDWHIGQKLYNNERYAEHEAFLNWLLDYIRTNQIDVLLVSGDVFDTTNPSNRALEIYYQFIAQCSRLTSQIIVTGGNHDSISTLNAAQKPLEALNVHVIGGATDKLEDELVLIKDKNGKPAFTVAAVPFLRDRNLKSSVSGESHEDRIRAIKEGIKGHYDALATLAEAKQFPAIAMGHLYASGSLTSDSERDIHIGNLGEISSHQFPSYFDYIALGHIHKPQKLGGDDQIRYSGSPLPLSFSERKDQKQVVLLHFDGKKVSYQESVLTPISRQLILVKGTLNEVIKKLEAFEEANDFETWVEVQLLEKSYSASLVSDFEFFKSNYKKAKILKYKIQFEESIQGADELFDEGVDIEDLSPREVFVKKVTDDPNAELLLGAFDELMANLEEKE